MYSTQHSTLFIIFADGIIIKLTKLWTTELLN